ncbi:MAG TPA: DUF4350 domain-containing protein [Xanthobacteraceae bacterium]
MNDESIFPPRILIGWISAGVALFAVSLYFMGSRETSLSDRSGPSAFSPSAIGYAGIAEVLQRRGIPVVKSRYNSLEKLSPGSVLVIAEPRLSTQSEASIRTLLTAPDILVVLPKWAGQPSEDHPGWLSSLGERPNADAQRILALIAARATVSRERGAVVWTVNELGLAPNIQAPMQLIRELQVPPNRRPPMRAILGGFQGILIGEIIERGRRIWVLSDPDVIANRGFGRGDNAALALAALERLRGRSGSVVFDETVHGIGAAPANPLLMLFQFPFVMATAQGLIAVALLLWATLARFGAPQVKPPGLSAGRSGLLSNMAALIEDTGQQEPIVRRYVEDTVRDVGRQLHAPREVSGDRLVNWLQRVGSARGAKIDVEAAMSQLAGVTAGRRRNISILLRLARQIHHWKGELIDGRDGHPRGH